MKINILDFIDFERVNTLLDGFNRTTGFVTAILDLEGNILSKSGWRRICTDFHRLHPETAQRCTLSDTILANKMERGEKYHFYKCLNGLVDVAVPIIMRGEHVANLFSGQFFFEKPDRSFFEKQAEKFGFDKPAYLEALDKVPVMSQESVKTAMTFLLNMTEMISELTFQQLEQAELIEQRKKSEETIRQSAALKRKMFANIGDVVVIIDKDGLNRYKSPNIEKLFGWKPEEVVGKSTWENVHPDDLASQKAFFEMLMSETGIVKRTECRYKCKDGSYKWIEFVGTNLVDDPDICGILGNYHDITERKAVENSLRESEERFKALHNASFGGITIHDKGMILECNQGLSDITGYSVDELIGMDGLLLIAEHSRSMVMEKIVAGYEKPYESTGVRKNGEVYPLRLEARNIPYKGKDVRTVEFRDISDQKKAEQEKEKLQDQLIQAQKMESVGRLAGGVAHDFNNMLSIILGNAEMISEDLDASNPCTMNLREIEKAARRSAELTRQLLAFARKQTITPKIIDLNRNIDGMMNMLKRLIGEDINLSWQPGENLWPVKIDHSQIDQMLVNLCINAKDAITKAGKITIETGNIRFDENDSRNYAWVMEGSYVFIAVSDNGCGMDNQTKENLFEPFFTTKKIGEGTGLGLSTVYGIVKQNDGFINVYSEINQGAAFKIYLPRHSGTMKDQTQDTQEELPPGNQETILLVEDEKAILKVTRLMLERMGYNVLAASAPEDALQISKKYKPGQIDLLMTDVVMPEMNGRDLANILLKMHPDLKCLFMSGYTANVIAHHGILDEGINFINKPFSKKNLAAKLREIFDAPD